MHASQPVQSVGRFQLVRHTGHTYDAAGAVVALGETLAATPLADNYFTTTGAAFCASLGPNQVSMGVSTNGTPPAPGRIGASVRTSSTLVSASTDRSLVPDSDGRVWWRKTYRFSFPAAPGLPTVRLRQASASVTGGPLALGVTSGVVSAALLNGPGGDPTAITVVMATESFDIVWEYTEYFYPEVTGSVTVRTVDGSNILLAESVHNYIMRPANLNNTADAGKGWGALADRLFVYMSAAPATIKLGLGTLGFTGSQPTFSEYINPSSITLTDPIVGAIEYVVRANLSFDDTTSTHEINCAQFVLGHTEWQVSFDPPIIKQPRHLATFSFGLITK